MSEGTRKALIFRRKAERLGTPATLTRPSQRVFQPSTGTFADEAESTQPQTYAIKGFFETSRGQTLQGQQIGGTLGDTHTRSHRFLIPEQSDVPLDALTGWRVTIAGRAYSIRRVEPAIVQGVAVFYGLVLDAS